MADTAVTTTAATPLGSSGNGEGHAPSTPALSQPHGEPQAQQQALAQAQAQPSPLSGSGSARKGKKRAAVLDSRGASSSSSVFPPPSPPASDRCFMDTTTGTALLTFRSSSAGSYSPIRHTHMLRAGGGDAIALPHSDISALSDIHRLALLEASDYGNTTTTNTMLFTGSSATATATGGGVSGSFTGASSGSSPRGVLGSLRLVPLRTGSSGGSEEGEAADPALDEGEGSPSPPRRQQKQRLKQATVSWASSSVGAAAATTGELVMVAEEGSEEEVAGAKQPAGQQPPRAEVKEVASALPMPSPTGAGGKDEVAAAAAGVDLAVAQPPAAPTNAPTAGQRIRKLLRLNLEEPAEAAAAAIGAEGGTPSQQQQQQSSHVSTGGSTTHTSASTCYHSCCGGGHSSAQHSHHTAGGGGANSAGGLSSGDGLTILQTSDGDVVRYENVRRRDGRITSHIKVAHKFAIGSKGMYTYPPSKTQQQPQQHQHHQQPHQQQQLCLSTTYPPGNGVIDEAGDNLLELGFLGRGAGSVEVVKALHFPSMRMVAVKKVPIDDPAKLAQAIHELEQLMTNQVTIRERVADDSTRVDPQRDGRPTAKKAGAEYCPFIVSLYDAYKHQAQLRLVMEYMNGGSLQDLVDKGGSSDEELLAKIAYNVLRGLHYLHGQGKIHRDVKPGNLLINSKNFVKIADFGLAASLDRVKPQTVGTNRFIPPELLDSPDEDGEADDAPQKPSSAQQQNRRWSTKGDIWSFGLSLWAIAEGARPFPHLLDDEVLIAAAVIDEAAPRVSESFSADFRDFVDRCLVKDPRQRASAEELLGHPFIRSKAYVHLNERELSHVGAKLTAYFRAHPARAVLTPGMARTLAQEVHLDERYVADCLRDALAGVPYTDLIMGPEPLTPPDNRDYAEEEEEGQEGAQGTAKGGRTKGRAARHQGAEQGRQQLQCCSVM